MSATDIDSSDLADEMHVVDAVYRAADEEPIPELKDNPMALWLPAPTTEEALFDALCEWPAARPENFRQLPLLQRLDEITRTGLFHFLFQYSIEIVLKVLSLVRTSFIWRHPANAAVIRTILSVASGTPGLLPRQSTVGGGGGLGMLLVGPSGVGKTSLVDRIVRFLGGERVRRHKSLKGRPCLWKQLGVIKVNVEPTWKATLFAIAQRIDSQLGTDYLCSRERGSTQPRLQQAVWAALTSHFCPMLILDEFQKLGKLNKKEALEILGGLVYLMESAGIPVLVVGTESTRALLTAYPAHLSKFQNEGVSHFSALPLGSNDANALIRTFMKRHVSTVKPTYSEDFVHQLQRYTMNITRAIREYFKVIYRRHACDESVVVNGDLLADISRKEMSDFEPALTVLRKHAFGIPVPDTDWARYEDYLPPERVAVSASNAEVASRWLAVKGPRAHLSGSDFDILNRKVSNFPGIDQTELMAELNEVSVPKAPVPKVAAPPRKRGRPPGTTSKGRKEGQGNVQSLDAARNSEKSEQPPSTDPDAIR